MDVRVPDLGDFSDVEVIDVLVKPGDAVRKEDPLITLETEKATMDVPSPAAGRISELKIGVGGTVSTGDVIAVLEAGETDADAGQAGAQPAAGDDSVGDASSPAAAGAEDDRTVRQPRPAPSPDAPAQPAIVTVPDLGDFADVEIIDVLVAVGDEVEAEQGLITLETEKATMDVPTPVGGTVIELRVEVGGKVNVGDEIAVVRPRRAGAGQTEALDEAAAGSETTHGPAPAAAGRPRRHETGSAPAREPPVVGGVRPVAASRTIDEATFSKAHASPSVRKLARELGVDLGRVRGSGPKGRIAADDVKAFVKQIMRRGGAEGGALPAVPEVDFAKYGPVETQPLSRIQRISGPRLHASWVNVPHVTQHEEADITELEQTRQSLKDAAAERGIRLTPLAFVLRASALALEEFPTFKASLAPDGRSLVLKRYTHLGFAVDTPQGLVVPVIRDADKLDVYEIAAVLGELSVRARDGKLKPDEIQGGVFSVSSLGGIGGTYFTPIINAPEVAILGVSRHKWKPVLHGSEFVPRLLLPLSLSYDHRVIDGALAARFVTRFAEILGQTEKLLEATP